MKTLFREEQSNKALWLKLTMTGATILAVGPLTYGMYIQFIKGIPFGDKPMSNTGLIITTAFIYVLMIIVNIIVFKNKLITEIDEEHVRFLFPPFIRKARVIHKSEIEKYVVRKYKPLAEYGGWGYRLRRMPYKLKDKERPVYPEKKGLRKVVRKSIAYTVKGNTGLQLYLKNGKELLIGTQRPQAIERAMRKMMEGA